MRKLCSGRRASLFTDYTFAVWSNEMQKETLLPIAKAYSGLTQIEIKELDKWIRKNTTEKFGPVRSVNLIKCLSFRLILFLLRQDIKVALRFDFQEFRVGEKTNGVGDANSIQVVKRYFCYLSIMSIRLPESVEKFLFAEVMGTLILSKTSMECLFKGYSGLIHAPTGTGKTLAACLGPFIENLNDFSKVTRGLRVIWITPMRALASDTEKSLREISKESDCRGK